MQMRKQLLGEQSACKLSCVGTREKSQLLLGLAPTPCLVGRGLRQNHPGEEFVPKRDTYLIPSHIPSCLLEDIGPEPPSLQHHHFSSCLIIPVSPQTQNRHAQHHLVNLSPPLVTVLVLFPPHGSASGKSCLDLLSSLSSCRIHAPSLPHWASCLQDQIKPHLCSWTHTQLWCMNDSPHPVPPFICLFRYL